MDYTKNSEIELSSVSTGRQRTRTRNRVMRVDRITGRRIILNVDSFDLGTEAGQYEGNLIRVDKNAVYKVENGVATYVPSLPTVVKGRTLGWPNVIEVGGKAKKGLAAVFSSLGTAAGALLGKDKAKEAVVSIAKDPAKVQTLKNAGDTSKKLVIAGTVGGLTAGLAPVLAPFFSAAANKVKSVIAGGTPVKADIVTTAVTNTPTNSNLANKILDVANNVPDSVKTSLLNKGKEIVSDKLGGWLTDPSLLPKSQGLKDAERYVDSNPDSMGYNNGISSVSLFNPTTIAIIAGVLVLIIVLIKTSK